MFFIVLTNLIWNFIFFVSGVIILLLITFKLRKQSRLKYGKDTLIVSFLHPNCNDCGGGEKVLWMMIKALTLYKITSSKKLKVNIICATKEDSQIIRKNLRDRFNIEFNEKLNSDLVEVELIRLKSGNLIKPKAFLTMLRQILGQIIFALETITTVYSDTYIDTTGLPFSYFVLNLLGRARVSAYVHYPFISQDMINDIKHGVHGVHSRGVLSKFKLFKLLKVLYYNFIFYLYKFNGFFLNFAFCNSTWTFNHIQKIWLNLNEKNGKLSKLYPPCSTDLYQNSETIFNKQNVILSFAQFRPEKNHKMQINILNKLKNLGYKDLKLWIIGAVRGPDDKQILDDLSNYARELNLENNVEFIVNPPFNEVKKLFGKAKIGIHTMRDEHFGISIIEMMAAGLITIAHKSAGPRDDIIGPSKICVGILANNEDEYVEAIKFALDKTNPYRMVTDNAKDWVKKFSNEAFMKGFIQHTGDAFKRRDEQVTRN